LAREKTPEESSPLSSGVIFGGIVFLTMDDSSFVSSATKKISHGAEGAPSPLMTQKSERKGHQRRDKAHTVENHPQSIPGEAGEHVLLV
jgi:hypothetical protein